MSHISTDRLIASLSTARTVPATALAAVMAQPQAVAPAIIAVVEKAADGIYLMPTQRRLLYWGMPALAAARHVPLCKPLLRLLRRPEDELEDLLGWMVDEMLRGMLLACWDGDTEALLDLAGDRSADDQVRWAVLDVLARLAHDGRIARQDVISFLHRFHDERLAEDGSLAWVGWQDAVQFLDVEELRGAVEASWDNGRNPQAEPDRAEWREMYAVTDRTSLFEEDGIVPLTDPVAALRRIERFSAPPAPRPKHPAQRQWEQRDPARRIRLNEEEQEWLVGFLASSQMPAGVMSIEELDGFMTALVAGPELVPPSEFLPLIWGETDEDAMLFEDDAQYRFVLDLILRHWETIALRLDADFPHIPLLYDWDDAPAGSKWAQGFGRAVGLSGSAWDPLVENEEMGPTILGPIVMLDAAGRDPELKPLDDEERKKFTGSLPLAILAIHRFWHEETAPAEPIQTKKIGRNEPCPCGSGRKYKHCCGSGSPPSIH